MSLPGFSRGGSDEQAIARRLRDEFLTERWDSTDHMPIQVRLVLRGLTDPRWWITHQRDIGGALASRLGPYAHLLSGGHPAAEKDPPSQHPHPPGRRSAVEEDSPSTSWPAPARRPPHVYVLFLSNPLNKRESRGTIVQAESLLYRELRQPAAGLMYRLVTEAPGRRDGEVVPLSTLDYELDGGRLWPDVCNYNDIDMVRKIMPELGRRGFFDYISVDLSDHAQFTLELAPNETRRITYTDGTSEDVTPLDRRKALEFLECHVARVFADNPEWCPGKPLISPPVEPPTMPYKPAI